MNANERGFTVVEVIISVFVLIILGTIGISSMYGARDAKNLDVIVEGLDAMLEQAKSDAIAGKGYSNHGVWFDADSYTYFQGSTYTAGASTNKITNLPGGWRLSTSTASGQSYVIFSRLSGAANTVATTTITRTANPALTRSIYIGSAGNITVIK